MEFKIDSEGDKHDDDHKITILEPQEIISLLMLLDEKDEASLEKTKQLRIPLKLIRNEMKISQAESFEETKKSIENAYQTFANIQGIKD